MKEETISKESRISSFTELCRLSFSIKKIENNYNYKKENKKSKLKKKK